MVGLVRLRLDYAEPGASGAEKFTLCQLGSEGASDLMDWCF